MGAHKQVWGQDLGWKAGSSQWGWKQALHRVWGSWYLKRRTDTGYGGMWGAVPCT